MIVKLDEKACSLDADELVAFVRLSFNADKDGCVWEQQRIIGKDRYVGGKDKKSY